MNDVEVRKDLTRLALIMGLMIGLVIGLKVYDTKTDVIGSYASKIYTKVFQK